MLKSHGTKICLMLANFKSGEMFILGIGDEARSIQLYKHLNLKSCIWTFDAYYDMTELIDVCGGSVTADFQARIRF